MKHISKTYKFKLRLTPNQSNHIDRMIGSCRVVYNLAKETKEYAYKSKAVSLSSYDLMKQLPELKKEYGWLKETPSGTLQDSIERLDKAYKSFFKGGGYPKWAKRDRYSSITFKAVKQDKYNRVILPKIGSVKYFFSQEMKGELRRATIIKENNNYYICILTKQEVSNLPYVSYDSQVEIGLDMGISYFCVTSQGQYFDNPRYFQNSQRQLRVENRSLARKKFRSNNWYKQKLVVGKLHTKVKNQRNDFLNKVSTQLIKENGFIAIENLNIKGMVKSRLSKSISDVSWGSFFEMLEYKAKWYDKEVIRINPAYTSQECSNCGHTAKENRLSQSKFKCIECGFTENADENASKNILARAIANSRQREALACA